jgi:REP element-mobilizing transposase RayT
MRVESLRLPHPCRSPFGATGRDSTASVPTLRQRTAKGWGNRGERISRSNVELTILNIHAGASEREVQFSAILVKPVRCQRQRCLHFVTFSCYQRKRLLDSATARETFEHELERVRTWSGCYVVGYVVMPEHVHLLISEPERSELSVVLQMPKQNTARKRQQAPSIQASSLLLVSGLERTEAN